MSTARSAFRTAVEYNLAGRSDATAVALIDEGLDSGCEEIANTWEWRELGTRTVSGVTNTNAGTWDNSTAYVIGDVVYDDVGLTYWRCAVAHTSAAADAMSDERTAHATYWVASTVEAHAQGALPSDVGEVLSVTLVDGTSSYEIPLCAREAVEAAYPVADQFAPQKPKVCYREGDLLFFAPEPSDTYTLRIIYDATLTLAAGADAEVSSTGFDQLLIAYATAWAADGLEHMERTAARWHRTFERMLARKKRKQGSSGVRKSVDKRLGRVGGVDQVQTSEDAARCVALGYPTRTTVASVRWW